MGKIDTEMKKRSAVLLLRRQSQSIKYGRLTMIENHGQPVLITGVTGRPVESRLDASRDVANASGELRM